eukprot:6172579-Pleurochrysis_carterae.AAC.4
MLLLRLHDVKARHRTAAARLAHQTPSPCRHIFFSSAVNQASLDPCQHVAHHVPTRERPDRLTYRAYTLLGGGLVGVASLVKPSPDLLKIKATLPKWSRLGWSAPTPLVVSGVYSILSDKGQTCSDAWVLEEAGTPA